MSDYLLDLESLIHQVPFGELQLSIKRHDGKVVGLVVNSTKSEKYTNGHNAEAAAEVLQMLKDAAGTGHSGALTFTVVFNQGQISRLVRQGYEQKSYQA